MLGFGKQKKIERAIGRCTENIWEGVFVDRNIGADNLGLNEQASMVCFYELLGHQFHALTSVYESTILGGHPFATKDFVIVTIVRRLAEADPTANKDLAVTMTSQIFDRINTYHRYTQDELVAGLHYAHSAKLVVDADPTADNETIHKILETASEDVMRWAFQNMVI